MRMEKSSPSLPQVLFLISLIEFLNKTYIKGANLTAIFFVEKQGALPFIVRREKNVSLSE